MPLHAISWRSILSLFSLLCLGLPSGLFLSCFPTKTLYAPIPHTCYMPCPSHSSRFDHLNNIWWGVQIIKLLIMYSSLLLCNVSPLVPNILLSTLFSNTLSQCSFLRVSNQVSHTYKTRGKIMGDLTLVKKSQWNRLVVRMVIKSIFHWECRSHLILLVKGSLLSLLTDKTAKVLLYMPWRHTVGAEVELYSFLTLALDGSGC